MSLNPSLTTAIEVPEGEFNLVIFQDNHAAIGETGYMNINVYSTFNVSMDIDISVILAAPYGDIILYNQSVILSAGSSWIDDIYYPFTEMGYYDVYLYVNDGFGREWKEHCWNLKPEGRQGGSYSSMAAGISCRTCPRYRPVDLNRRTCFSIQEEIKIYWILRDRGDEGTGPREVYWKITCSG